MSVIKRRLLHLSLGAFVAFALVACGEDEGPPRQEISGGNNGGEDTGLSDADDASENDDTTSEDVSDGDGTSDDGSTTDAGDSEDQTDGGDTTQDGDTGADTDGGTEDCMPGDCAEGELCVEGTCEVETATLKCQMAEDVGLLPMDTDTTVSGSLLDQSDVMSTACGQNIDEGGELVYRFSVDEVAELTFDATWNGQFDGLLDFRTGDCASGSTSSSQCFDAENESIVVEPGQDYYMVIEHTVGRADDFSVTLNPSPLACVPGTTSCTDETLERCSGSGTLESFNCAAACSSPSGSTDSTSCQGDVCADAIEVNGSGTFVGNVNAYESNVDFGQIAGCEVGGTAIDTPGAEVVFKISGAPAGAHFEIDAETNDSNNNAIFVTSNCGAPSSLTCIGTYLTDEKPIWTVPQDNSDYYIFIDKTSNTGNNFQYKVSAVTSNQ